MSALITINHLSKSYSDKAVLRDIDLSVHAGQIVGLVGPNGAGKTTCLQALLGLTPYKGSIDVMGFKPNKQRTEMLHHVAYIADVAVLPKWMSVEQALSYVEGVHPNFSREKAERFLAKTNIPTSAKIKALSKGMVTQLHLALILAIDAKILVLDEPTLGLDILTRRQFYHHLLEEFYTEQKCIIVTTHQIEEIEHILTDVAFIQEGQILLSDNVEQIRQRFQLLTVADDKRSEADKLQPLYANSMMGLTTMLFDNVPAEELAQLGKVAAPSLADIFVGMMGKETTA